MDVDGTTDTLETERLILRATYKGDLAALSDLHADLDVMQFLGDGRAQTPERTGELLQQTLDHWRRSRYGLWTMLDKRDRTFVGQCGVADLHQIGAHELAYTLARPYWGRGVATEAVRAVLRHACEVVRLPRVVGIVSEANVAFQRVMVKGGMTHWGTFQADGKQAMVYGIEARPR